MVTRAAHNAGLNSGTSGSVTVNVTGWSAGEQCVVLMLWYGTQTVTSVTMTGESNLTVLGSPQTGGPDNGRLQWAVLDSVTGSGAKDIVANLTGTPASFTVWVWRVQNAGSHGTPVGGSGSGTTMSVNVTTTVANAMILSGGTSNGGTSSAGAGYTKETIQTDGYWYDGSFYDEDVGAQGSKTPDATMASGTWVFSAIEIYQSGGGGGSALDDSSDMSFLQPQTNPSTISVW